jgi:hypothetical protein
MEIAKILIGIRRIAFIAGRMFSKLKREEKAVVVMVSFTVLLVTISPHPAPSSSKASLGQLYLKTDDATSDAMRLEQEVQSILVQIQQKYNFSRFIETWGVGTQGLYLPEEAWNQLSLEQRQVLIDYAQSKNLRGIVVGRQLGPNNIALDRTVWGS